MYSEERQTIQRVVDNFFRTGNASDEHVNVTSLPENKSSYVEYIDKDGRSVELNEYHLDEKVIWAGFSARTQTVYLSPRTT